jgi:sulfonate transport system substrate-binding protein
MSFTGSASARAGFSRRSLVKLGLSAAALGLTLERTLPARATTRVVRIGFQKYGALILLKGRGLLERQLKPLGYDVQWVEYPAGPQLLAGLNDGAIDFGATGEAPPIFAQAAGTPLVYVAHEPPAPQGEAILVQKNSAIRSLAELKGKKIALNRGSNVHYLLVKALEKAAIAYSDVETVFLPPDDARRAFDHGSVDAWAIWDPYQAAAETTIGASTLVNGEGHQQVVDAIIAAIGELDDWANGNTEEVAAELSREIGFPADVLKIALGRQSYGVKPLSSAVVAEQQKVADAFLALKLIAGRIIIADAVR